MKKVILVTGATGYIGSNIVKKLISEEYDVHILVRRMSKYDIFGNEISKIKIHVYDGDIEKLSSIFENISPEMVIHLASLFISEHKFGDIKELIDSNVTLGSLLLEMCKANNVKYFINTGTCWQDYLGGEYNPVNLYAATKESFEVISKYYIETSSMRMITLKLMDTYGPMDQRNKIINLLKKIAVTGEWLSMSEGEQEIGLVYIDDVVEAFKISMREIVKMPKHSHKHYVVSPKNIYTLKEVVHIFENEIGVKLNIRWGERKYREREMMKLKSGHENILNQSDMIDLKYGIKKMLLVEKNSV